MKLLVLLVMLSSLVLSPSAVVATGNGDAAALVAAQNKGAIVPAAGTQDISQAFLLSGSAKVFHVDGGPVAGGSVFKHSLNTADALACVQHDASVPDCNDGTLPENDKSPGVYLFVDSLTQWRLADNPAADDAATLTGLVDSKGGFQMAGDFDFTSTADGNAHQTHIFLSGKAKFEKGTLSVTKISGKFEAVSTDMQHYAKGSFKTMPLLQ
jgi:hypothetical protein